MTDADADVALLVKASTIDDLARARLRAAAHAEIDRLRSVDTLARAATAPAAAGVARIRTRLALGARATRPTPGVALVALVALAAAAAAAVIVVVGWPAGDEVALSIQGSGQVVGPRHEPVVELAHGRLDATVAPNRGTRMEVRTEEATVAVIGTAFSVVRDRFATDVAVDHGTVEVRCVGKAPVRVSGGGSHRCLPSSASGLLRRVVALSASPDANALRGALDAGLAAPDALAPVRAELLAHDVRVRAAAGDPAALGSAEAYLSTGETVRRPEMLAFVAAERFARGGCDARDALERAVEDDPRSVLAVALASCVVDGDPARAQALLDAVAEPGPWQATADAVRSRIRR